jgi:hypothetical protein
MGAIIAKHAYKDFIEAAIADGWTAANGPWGYAETNDFSVTLTKHFPKLKGSILIWMIHRNVGVLEWSEEEVRWVHRYPEDQWTAYAQSWHKADTGGDHGLDAKLDDILANGLSEDFWNALAHTCDNCGKVVEHLNHVAFANKACDECASGMRQKMERPGWAD